MANLANAASLLDTSIVYDERTSRYNDLAQNYKMVSAKRIDNAASGSMSRDDKPRGEYVPLDMFKAFQRDVYMFISNTASFAREAIIELQRSLTSERRDTQDIRNEEFRVAEERSEKGRNLLRKIGSTLSTGTRAVTGMGLGGTLLSGAALAAITMLSGMSDENIQRIAKPIDGFIEMIDEIRKKISEYSGLLTAVGAGLLGLAGVAAALQLLRPPSAPNQGRTPPGSNRSPPGAGSAGKPSGGGTTGGGGGTGKPAGAGAGGAGAAPKVPGAGAAPIAPKVPGAGAAPIAETDKSGNTKFRDPTTGKYVKAPSGAPTPAPTPKPPVSGAPEPTATKNTLPRRMIRAGALGAVLSVIPDGIDAYRLIRERNSGSLSEEEFKQQMVDLLGKSLGGIGGAAAGAAIGTLLGPVGSIIGGVAGGAAGSMYGPEIAQALFKAYLDENEAPEDYYEQMAKGAEIGANMQTELSNRLAQLRTESRERTVGTERTVRSIEEAVASGRITEEQAEQLRRQEKAFQPTTPEQLRENISRIEGATQEALASGIDPRRLELSLGRDNLVNVKVLPPIIQEVRGAAQQAPQPAPPASTPTGVQTRNSDNTLGDAFDYAAAAMTAAF